MKGRVLSIAGSDSSGGAGIQADVKTITALGGYAATAITALTAQSTLGVLDVLPIPPSFVEKQIRVVLDDLGADAVKTGMLVDAPTIVAVVDALIATRPLPLVVVDPVMIAKGGASLLAADATRALLARLLPLAALVTPNAPEATALTGLTLETPDDLERAGEALLELGARAALVKGGHLPGTEVVDVLVSRGAAPVRFSGRRQPGRSTHGTGCTLAAAIATSLAQGLDLPSSALRAKRFVEEAIRTAPGLGAGHGPLNHAHGIAPWPHS